MTTSSTANDRWVAVGHSNHAIAEGVETEDQHVKLRALGCALGQGFLFSKAVPHDAIPGLLFADAQRDRPAA